MVYVLYFFVCLISFVANCQNDITESKLHQLDDSKSSGRSMRRALKLYEWGPATEHEIKTNKIKTLLFVFYDNDNISLTKTAKEALHAIAYDFSKKDILHIMVEKEHTQIFQFFLKDEEDADYPFSVIVEVDKGFRKYRLNTPIDYNTLKEFEKRYFDKKLSPWLRSEETLGSNSPLDIVYPLVGSEFHKKVVDDKKDVLVFFFAPWCGHCKRFEPRFRSLAEKFINVHSVTFMKIDVTKNDVDHPHVHVHRVPYVRLFPAKRKKEPVAFEHSRPNVEEYGVDFLKRNVDIPFDLNKADTETINETIEL